MEKRFPSYIKLLGQNIIIDEPVDENWPMGDSPSYSPSYSPSLSPRSSPSQGSTDIFEILSCRNL